MAGGVGALVKDSWGLDVMLFTERTRNQWVVTHSASSGCVQRPVDAKQHYRERKERLT